MKCQYCGKEEVLPFKCQYCQGLFCAEHRLPENHACQQIEKAKPPKEEALPFEYKVTYTPHLSRTRFWFSPKEIEHLTISAVLVIGVGFSIMFSSGGTDFLDLPLIAVAALMFVGLFLLHEIAHKLVAQHYGLWAEFRLILFGVFLTLLSVIPFSFFKIIAPGAVMIAGSPSREIMGKTAVAGPLTNIILSIISLQIAYFVQPIASIAIWSFTFNAWIALFNVIPFGMLDGLKIFEWNKIVWAVVFTLALALTIMAFF